MRKIFLSVIIALSFQTIAQTSSLDVSKILEPSKEEERRFYKELNAKINPPLIHDEKAPLVTEDECFAEAYDELKTYMERVDNETNTKYRGYENQIKQLTEFTNKKARGMGCKRATLFYKRELYDNLRSFVKREAKNQERIEQVIEQDKAANLKIYEEGKKMEEEKEFNSNPKNFPYKENWFDYEKGIYEINLIEVEGKEKENLLTKIKLPKECEYHGEKFQVPVHALKYNKEELMGLAVYMKEDEKLRYIPSSIEKEQKKIKAIKINFGSGHLSNFNGIFYYDIYDYQSKNPYSSFNINFVEYKKIKFGLHMEFSTHKYIEKIDNFKFKIFPNTRFSILHEYFDDYIFIYSSDCISMDERIKMEDRENGSFIDNTNKD